ncbi:MAG TPA: DUF362 domain-containing protein [Terracidiphilus sp.]|nr:DUF362 domain-containing protein [Terracidiphilus sp.]
MTSRREFLREAVSGAALLGACAGIERVNALGERAHEAKSRVVVARDAALRMQGSQPEEQGVLALLDKAMAAYTGREKPAEAWQRIAARGRVVGLKVNGLGGRGISTHAVLIHAICERLQQAGVPAGDIIVWDRNARDLAACGMSINSDGGRVRCYGSDTAGFEDQAVQCGAAQLRLSKILTRDCGIVISVPILKDHNMSGLTFSMKNMYGVVDRPYLLHANNCNPGVADVNALSAVRQKVRFTIGDALTSVYEGGPVYSPEHFWRPNALILGEDPVAVDCVALLTLDGKRVQEGLSTLKAAGREPRYITTAADSVHRLGTNDPRRMQLVEV